ncbi:hemolysin family protein [Bifidobacterium psychraerophilum]|jgi:putative hemolysin|uniref:hemolysin family protein n=1 Tax=Bifidobacterium psychraerophilum TaxID=218140 RepID=UPI0023F493B5|nr:hemolysin family protein [Bifidobacterium psychraerophilum]MCI1659535.1 hemolysin family protein [Bifidobacterium psychraerophilum]MCI1804497.1 hemolysin family protein [Bifidobacterium psychraerophilum]MCI2176347.1 hemolysin family protein [Bifidobacterium psychraerophilum]MCI2181179.1 hemolysin family protein [Bifidobacterium psychraerophilum]
MSLWLNIVLIVVFLVIGAVFSGTELALVSLRGSQVERMEQEDARGARVGKIARDPNTFLSTVQIGVTLSGFLSSSVGASSIAPFLIPVFERWGVPTNLASPLVTVVLTIVIAYFSIVISELVPKRIAMQRAEQIARAAVPAIDIFSRICRPLIWLIGKNTNGIVRLLGFDPQQAETQVSDDELRVLVSSNTRLSKDERTILDDVFDASETIVAEVMRPRADVVFLDGDMPLAEAAAFVRNEPYSRYPVSGKDFDDVLGFVHVRDLLDIRDPEASTVRDVVREGIELPGTSKLLPSLELLRKRGIHLAVVIDEYGGTDGIVTLEDMTEELVGDIRDEYDLPDDHPTKQEPQQAFVNGAVSVEGGMTLQDFADLTGIELEDGPYETVAGYFLAHTGRMGEIGEVLRSDGGYEMKVTKVDGRRIGTIEVKRRTDDEHVEELLKTE